MNAMCEDPIGPRPPVPAGTPHVARRRLLGQLAASTVLAPCAGHLVSPAIASAQRDLHFRALRDGAPIGEHSVTFRSDGNRQVVTTHVHMTVKVLFFTIYHLQHDAEEIWQDGRLVRVESTTDDDGTFRQVSGRAIDGGFLIRGDAGTLLASANLLTSNSLWDSRILRSDRLIDVQYGGEIDLFIRPLCDAQVETPQASVRTRRHILITPHYAGIFFHSGDGRWVKALIDANGEIVEYTLAS